MEYDKLQDKKMNATGDERKRFLEMQVDLLLSDNPHYDREDCMIEIEVWLDRFYARGFRFCSDWIAEDEDGSVEPIEDDLEKSDNDRSELSENDMSDSKFSFGIWNDDCHSIETIEDDLEGSYDCQTFKYDKKVHSIHTGSSEWKEVGRKKRFAKEHKSGVVISFKNGWGWIDGSSGKIFVHNKNIKMKGFRALTNGQKVTFDIGLGKNGGFQAINVIPVT